MLDLTVNAHGFNDAVTRYVLTLGKDARGAVRQQSMLLGRKLVQFTPPNGGSDAALLFFRRYDENGNKLITPRSRNFRIEFEPSFLDSRNRYAALLPRSIEFRVKDLVVNGQVDF